MATPKNKLPDVQNLEHGLHGQYRSWFLEYASYVILERAVPAIEDGLKPVQRRILHAMKEMDDGRFNKVANVIGQAMQYHPHGDASIGDALVNLGQKDLLIDIYKSKYKSMHLECRLNKLKTNNRPKTMAGNLPFL